MGEAYVFGRGGGPRSTASVDPTMGRRRETAEANPGGSRVLPTRMGAPRR